MCYKKINKKKKPKASFSLESLKRTKIKMYQRHRKAREVAANLDKGESAPGP